MIKLYLDEDMRESLLNYEIENKEMYYEDYMYYMTTSEKEILKGIIMSLLGWADNILNKLGFYNEDIEILNENDYEVQFTNKNRYYLKEVN